MPEADLREQAIRAVNQGSVAETTVHVSVGTLESSTWKAWHRCPRLLADASAWLTILRRMPTVHRHLLAAPPLYSIPVCNVLVPVCNILVRGIG